MESLTVDYNLLLHIPSKNMSHCRAFSFSITAFALSFAFGADALIGQATLVNFDGIPSGAIGASYLLNPGVEFVVGNGSAGSSTGPLLISGQVVSARCGNFGTSISQPNVMVPRPGTNEDIWVRFYGSGGRIAASAVGIKNDSQGSPSRIFLEAFDQTGASLGVAQIDGAGVYGTVAAPNIWTAKISGAPGYGGLLGVDDFQFTRAIGGGVTRNAHACGLVTIAYQGGHGLGDTFTATLGGVSGVPLIGLGVSPGATSFCSCVIGHEWSAVLLGASQGVAIPNTVMVLGFTFAVQGADFFGSGGCPNPMIGLSDTLVVTVG